ncbi:hypothetical protein SAMN04488056_11210 [Cohaesibacter marisflavi]|uniref:Uncharacterized protein n=1 Tax=Cohaesibacter marisflavi TaxID=655353 RepID=A0A1I5JP26_9HYPH|nr:hypothetical protein [Cohaesibacter marisflavi]SFO74538.1 hypothetical protein SAMN04488056_11210 [Cohaesibacter marisflavi]
MERLATHFGWIGNMLIMLSVLCLVYSGCSFTHADVVQTLGQKQLSQFEIDQSLHDMGPPCQGCPQMQDEQQMHCGGQILALSCGADVPGPILSHTVPAHTIRDFIAQIFSPDPPPPRFA